VTEAIEIKGIRELQAALRQAGADLPKQLRLVHNDAVDLVLDYARPRFPKKSGRAAGSLKARSSQRESRIALGGRRAPYAPGLDFGGGRPQFPPYQRGGRYVYKGLEVQRDKIVERLAEGLRAAAVGAGLEIS
jgi:hypothetical protein